MFFEVGQGQLAITVAYLFVGLATFFVAKKLLQEEEARAAQENLEENRNRKASNPFVNLTRPIFSQYIVPMVRGKKIWDERRKIYRRNLISAGLKDELTPDELIAFKMAMVVVFPIIGGILRSADVLEVSFLTIFGLTVVGWYYPDFWINSRIKVRHKQILKSLPFVVDLLALSTEAGLDFINAIGKVVEKAVPGPLIEELEQLLKEIKVGASRAEAMHEMAKRINMPEVNSFIAILVSADQMGASIGKILRQQSDQIRTQRFVNAEKAGALAAQKLLIPLMLFIFPAVLLMVIGPFLLGVFAAGGAF